MISKPKTVALYMLCFVYLTCSVSLFGNSENIHQDSTKIKLITDFNFKPNIVLKNIYDIRIISPLPQLMNEYYEKKSNEDDFMKFAKSKDINSIAYKIQIVVDFNKTMQENEINENALAEYEIEHLVLGSTYIKGYFPIYKLNDLLADYPDIRRIRKYWRPTKKSITTEGFAKVGAADWFNAGYKGQGIKVAIIDDGFEHISALIGSGDFKSGYHSKDFSGYGFPGIDDHGSECAAIIYDFAPDAEFYLINVDDVSDVTDAKNYCITNGVNVISMSLGWDNYYYGDGKGELCTAVDDAEANGILWVNCSGNEARDCYYKGSYSDPDADDWHNFTSGDESNTFFLYGGDTVFIRLTWDGSLNNCNQDYDLYLFDSSSTQVDFSNNVQNGSSQAVETIIFTAMYSDYYNIAISRCGANGTAKFRLFCSLDYELEYADPSNSLAIPGDAKGSFTIGAIDEWDWYNYPALIEDFSSRGPTSDGRIKPDICAPDGTSEQYGWNYFYGTSCSAPHAAGIAVVYWSSNISMNCTQVRNYLQSKAMDCGTVGFDNIFGYGKIDLSTIPPPDDKYEPNNTHAYAYDFSNKEGVWLDTINGLGIQANEDWYKITANQGFTNVKVECTFDHSLGNIDIELRNSVGNSFTPVSGSTLADSTTDDELLECEVASYGSFYIRVFNGNCGNEYNLRWEITQQPPNAPTGFKVDKVTKTTISLSWDTVAAADKYVIEQSNTDSGPWNVVYDDSATNYTDIGLTRLTTYWYRIKSVNANGESGWSAVISGTTLNKSASSAMCGAIDCDGNAGVTQILIIVLMIFTHVLIRTTKRYC